MRFHFFIESDIFLRKQYITLVATPLENTMNILIHRSYQDVDSVMTIIPLKFNTSFLPNIYPLYC